MGHRDPQDPLGAPGPGGSAVDGLQVDGLADELLGAIEQERLAQLQQDDGFLAHMDRVEEALNRYMTESTWFQETYGSPEMDGEALAERYRIAYFSAEFGIHESIPIYSGGLGLLAHAHQAGGAGRVHLSSALGRTAERERYLAAELAGRRYDIGVKYGLLTAQLALALSGPDRDEVLTNLIELLPQT